MRLVTFTAGVAVGYVLGTRAGREKYEQIVDNARRLRANPTLEHVQLAARNLTTPPSTPAPAAVEARAGAPAPAVTTKPVTATEPETEPATEPDTAKAARPRTPRPKKATPATVAAVKAAD